MAQFTKVASTADLAPGAAKCVEVAGDTPCASRDRT